MKYGLLILLLFAGCVAAPSKVIVVLDESGRPVSGAAPHPQVLNPFNPVKRSDKNGKLKIYRLGYTGRIKINAPGYEPSWINYDDEAVVKLKKEAIRNEN